MKKNTSAYAKALKLLTRRDHSQYELTQKLAIDYPDDEVTEAIERCQQEHWLDDTRFAESYIRYRSDRGYGPLRITQELKQKGVDSDTISTAYHEAEVQWREVLFRFMERRYQSDFSAPDLMKFQQYFLRKGFSLEVIRQCLTKLRHAE